MTTQPLTVAESFKRQCGACGDPLRRRKNESWTNWQKRHACGPACANELKSITMRATAAARGEMIHWPKVEPVYIPSDYFASQNIDPGDGGDGRIVHPPSNRTLGGVQGWAFR